MNESKMAEFAKLRNAIIETGKIAPVVVLYDHLLKDGTEATAVIGSVNGNISSVTCSRGEGFQRDEAIRIVMDCMSEETK